ncbi:MAG: hypothetical protein MUE90_06080 [Thermoanaerobaculales bacterium]|nr:hypothetical protein [Thermoanaerobaculales bacterium]
MMILGGGILGVPGCLVTVDRAGAVVGNEAEEESMSESFTSSCRASRVQTDFNAHLADTARLDLAADARLMSFEERGFAPRELEPLPSSLRGAGDGR